MGRVMKRIVILIAIILGVIGCKKPKPTIEPTVYYVGDTFSIKYYTCAEVWDTLNPNEVVKIRIKFDSIYDARCPYGYPICDVLDLDGRPAKIWFHVIINNKDTLISEGSVPNFDCWPGADSIFIKECPIPGVTNLVFPDLGDYWLCIRRLMPCLDTTNTDGVHLPPKGILFPKSKYRVLVKVVRK